MSQPSPKLPDPPAVPSFGFALPPKPSPVEEATAPNTQPSKKKKIRKNNQLGLTPEGELHENSDEYIDEETTFAQFSQPISIQYRERR
jgi:hypothetical protein